MAFAGAFGRKLSTGSGALQFKSLKSGLLSRFPEAPSSQSSKDGLCHSYLLDPLSTCPARGGSDHNSECAGEAMPREAGSTEGSFPLQDAPCLLSASSPTDFLFYRSSLPASSGLPQRQAPYDLSTTDLVEKPWHQHQRSYHSRHLTIVAASSNGRKAFFIDTLALVRKLEAEGLTGKQSEAITHVITEVLHESLESAAQTFVSKADMQKAELVQEAAIARLKTELQGSVDIRLAGVQRDVESQRADLEKVKSEIKYDIDKVTSGQRLDLNLERGRVKDELNLQAQETSNLSNKLDREVNSLKAQLEAAKFDVIRYCVGTLVSVSAVGLGVLRILM